MSGRSMNVCHNCGAEFFEFGYRVEKELHFELDGNPIETLYFPICPNCGSEDFDLLEEEEEEEE